MHLHIDTNMRRTVNKNDDYSKLMLTEGAVTIVDKDTKYVMELPEWADKRKIKTAQRFFFLNLNAMTNAMLYGLMAILHVESVANVLIFTKQSSASAPANKRFKAKGLHAHAQIWYQNSLEPGTLAWQSLDSIRRMHVGINKRSTKAGIGILSQKDMAISQFLFMGFQLLMPDEFGITGSYEQFDAFNHFWRLIGYVLGTEDRFNCCGDTLEETKCRLMSIRDHMLLPAFKNPLPVYENFSRSIFDALRVSDTTIHYDSTMFMIKRAVGVPGYYYFDSESSEYKEENKKIFERLSLYTRFRIFLQIIILEHFSHIFIFRWIFNFFRTIYAGNFGSKKS